MTLILTGDSDNDSDIEEEERIFSLVLSLGLNNRRGGGGLQKWKIADLKLFAPPPISRQGQTFVPPSLNLNLPYPVLMIDKGSRAVIHIIGSGDGTMSTTNQDPKLVVRLSIGVCGRKLVISLLC